MRFLYTAATWLLTPFLLLHLYRRSLANPGYRRRIGERFGYCGFRAPRPAIWIHAASVGEVQAAAALIRTLAERHPERSLVVTTLTPTGSDRVRELFGEDVLHCYVPWELRGAVDRFLDAARPVIAVIMETEIWPNLYLACHARGIPVLVANGRLSTGSVRTLRLGGALIRDVLSGVEVAAQTDTDAARFIDLGAGPQRVHVTGNLKFDFDIPPEITSRAQDFRRQQAADRPVWIAGSTHDEEELAVIAVQRMVLAAVPDALLVLVPRHPERFASVAALLDREGMTFVSRSSGERCEAATQVMLGDTMGELTLLYAAADVAFVGGSLVDVGGHNLLEPAALGVPVLSGPHYFNAPETAELLIAAGAAEIVSDSEALAQRVTALLRDPARRQAMGEAGRATVARNRGALQRIHGLVENRLRSR